MTALRIWRRDRKVLRDLTKTTVDCLKALLSFYHQPSNMVKIKRVRRYCTVVWLSSVYLE
jgi:hypothetical protein